MRTGVERGVKGRLRERERERRLEEGQGGTKTEREGGVGWRGQRQGKGENG